MVSLEPDMISANQLTKDHRPVGKKEPHQYYNTPIFCSMGTIISFCRYQHNHSVKMGVEAKPLTSKFVFKYQYYLQNQSTSVSDTDINTAKKLILYLVQGGFYFRVFRAEKCPDSLTFPTIDN